jgi:Ni,Fe-hydrogenase III component G
MMNFVEHMLATLSITDSYKDPSGVTWFATGNLDLRELAAFLTQAGARFMTITATVLPRDEGFCLDYLWDMEGQMLGFAFYLKTRSVPSIYDLCEAADWIEREIHEEFDIEFTGRAYEPLLLRTGDEPGVHLHEVAK